MFINLIVVIISLCICNQIIMLYTLNILQFYLSTISIKLGVGYIGQDPVVFKFKCNRIKHHALCCLQYFNFPSA